jgi:hypothetical protein
LWLGERGQSYTRLWVRRPADALWFFPLAAPGFRLGSHSLTEERGRFRIREL